MNIKKRLEQEAKSTHQKILEEDNNCFLNSLPTRDMVPQKRRHCAYHWKLCFSGVVCTISAMLIIVCAVLFIPKNSEIIYYEQNFQSSTSDMSSLNTDLKDFQIYLKDNLAITNLKRTIDGLSGDLLYYEMALQSNDNLIRTSLTIVCNKHYHYEKFHKEDESLIQAQLTGYTLLYSFENTKTINAQSTILKAVALIEGKNETIYITDYQEVSFDKNGSFLEFIQSLIKVKE